MFSPQSSLQSVSSEVSTEMLRPEIRTKTGEKEARNRVNPVDLPSLSLRKPYYIVLSYSNGSNGKMKNRRLFARSKKTERILLGNG